MSEYKLVPAEPTPEMVEAAEEAYMPFGDMDLAVRMAILAAPAVPAYRALIRYAMNLLSLRNHVPGSDIDICVRDLGKMLDGQPVSVEAPSDAWREVAALVAPDVQGEPVAYLRKDQLRQVRRMGPMLGEIANSPRDDRVPVYTAPQPTEQQPDVTRLVNALESLVKGYVNLLEAGKDRITSLGGDCDPVPVMEHNDPWLRDARVALAPYRKGGNA